MRRDQLTPQDQITYLWVTVFGATGSNGLHGTIKGHGEEIKSLGQSIRRHDALEAQIIFVARALQWVALAVLTTVGLLISGPLADLLRGLLGVGK